MPKLIQAIPEGALAIIGDVHGEIDALEQLLSRLDALASETGTERALVFVGDLVDRGPDSVSVVRRVGELIARRRAVATLGNHELNILQGDRKEGNGWFYGEPDHAQLDGKRVPFASRLATEAERREVRDVIGALPLVLERPDLRVVHAGWSADAARRLPREADVAVLARETETALCAELSSRGVSAAAAAERAQFANLEDERARPDRHLSNVAEEDYVLQTNNPVKVLTSGAEIQVAPGQHFFTGGKWRFVTRDRWWRDRVDRPTVIGHYWRRRGEPIPGKVDVWDDVLPFAWSGDVFCIDYSVGRRFAERAAGASKDFRGGLGALLWPEREVLFDDRESAMPTSSRERGMVIDDEAQEAARR